MGAVDPEATGPLLVLDQGEVAVEVPGLRPERASGAEAIGTERVAQLVVVGETPHPGDQALLRVEDEPSSALLDQLGQGAKIADDDRGALREGLEDDVAERLVD